MSNQNNILDKADKYIRPLFDQLSDDFTYHNIEHTLRVVNSSKNLAYKAQLNDENRELLVLAAYFHDMGFLVDHLCHEEHSCSILKPFLEDNNFDSTKKDRLFELINSTQHGEEPKGKLEQLLNDADTSNLASDYYNKLSGSLRKEKEKIREEKIGKKDWVKENISFFEKHRYYSKEGIEMYSSKKEKNLEKLKEKLISEVETSHLSNSKAAITQFKTALRNHIDLSAIADNKANIMLSINALILTISLPMISNILSNNKMLLWPSISLITVCILTIIFATLSTRPIKMSGLSSIKDIKNRESNLFFFGNFFKMTLKDYEAGIQQVLENEFNLDASITRDLYFLGKALGKKYAYLRICYNIFMFGVILTTLLFVSVWIIAVN